MRTTTFLFKVHCEQINRICALTGAAIEACLPSSGVMLPPAAVRDSRQSRDRTICAVVYVTMVQVGRTY